jgi:hypothetical protein
MITYASLNSKVTTGGMYSLDYAGHVQFKQVIIGAFPFVILTKVYTVDEGWRQISNWPVISMKPEIPPK